MVFEANARLILAVLAVWRITHLLANEDGPADVIFRLRAWLGDRFWGRLMDCFQCLSLWVAAPAAVFATRRPADCLLAWLALSGAACLLERLGGRPADTIPQTSKGESEHVLWPETSRITK
ncbi:MAG TPA: hypothetical protein VGS58_13365 [Candidatus Sulfopaludibacter sp.]|nr:hypothetical protein [Candidatus Sulfopaludibacter sp.]